MAEKSVSIEALDELHRCLTQARAMAEQTYASTGESFRKLHDSTQDEFMWAICSKIEEAQKFAAAVWSADNTKAGAP